MPVSGSEAADNFGQSGYMMLDISNNHAVYVETLPPLSTDPFDRMLVVQALAEPMRLLTHYKALTAYSDTVILV